MSILGDDREEEREALASLHEKVDALCARIVSLTESVEAVALNVQASTLALTQLLEASKDDDEDPDPTDLDGRFTGARERPAGTSLG